MGLGQEGVEMQWVPREQAGALLGRQAAESFPLGHTHVLRPPRRVCLGCWQTRCPTLSSGTRREEAGHPPSPAHPSSSVPLCTPGTTAALCTLCPVGTNSSHVVPAARVVPWMGRLLEYPLGLNTQECLNLEL